MEIDEETSSGRVVGDSKIPKLTLEDCRKVIRSFTKEQLVQTFEHVAAKNLDVALESVRLIRNRDLYMHKLYVLGLGCNTTDESLRTFFSSYGELEKAAVVIDEETRKSKGYGFITFKFMEDSLLALKEPWKKIDGRMTLTRLLSEYNFGEEFKDEEDEPWPHSWVRSISVSNVPSDMPPDLLLAQVLLYGEIDKKVEGFDIKTGKWTEWVKFHYKTDEAARASLVQPTKTIDGHQIAFHLVKYC
ncbi:hypothetical protein IFM89_026389 [Coptis chinensis]|uniref:RRM domain-containing protein n=1 Tax=Coptis chinensis TaxID=261450 RepID=A0A835I866_9MAGN|nr:hypothetical protein IFM89_026389 [Coptis chinensis]